MGLYDRDYTQADFPQHGSQYRFAPQMRLNFPRLTPVVKWLLIINVSVFLAAVLIRPLGAFIYAWFQLDATSVGLALQPWRLITYQFLHDPNFVFHIFVNMLGLFFWARRWNVIGVVKDSCRFISVADLPAACFISFLSPSDSWRPA